MNGNNRDEDGAAAVGYGCGPTGTLEKLGDLGRSIGASDCEGKEEMKQKTSQPLLK